MKARFPFARFAAVVAVTLGATFFAVHHARATTPVVTAHGTDCPPTPDCPCQQHAAANAAATAATH
jgi:hypothetical protein